MKLNQTKSSQEIFSLSDYQLRITDNQLVSLAKKPEVHGTIRALSFAIFLMQNRTGTTEQNA